MKRVLGLTVVPGVFVADRDDGKPSGNHHDCKRIKLRGYGSAHAVYSIVC
jgi:hypothetical protein